MWNTNFKKLIYNFLFIILCFCVPLNLIPIYFVASGILFLLAIWEIYRYGWHFFIIEKIVLISTFLIGIAPVFNILFFQESFKIFETKASLCIFPFLFFSLKKYYSPKTLSYVFLGGVVGLVLITYVKGLLFMYQNPDRSLFETNFNVNRPIISYITSLGICILFVLWRLGVAKKTKILLITIFTILFIMPFFLASRMPIIINTIIVLIFLFYEWWRTNKKLILGILLVFIVSFLGLLFFTNALNKSIERLKDSKNDVRKVILESAFNSFSEKNYSWVTGFGSDSNYIKAMNKNMTLLLGKDHPLVKYHPTHFILWINAHNSILDYMLSFGVFWGIFMLIYLLVPFYIGWVYKNLEFWIFGIIQFLFSMIDPLFSGASGITSTTIVLNLLVIFLYNKTNKTNSLI